MIIDDILSTNTIREKAALYFPSHGINEPADNRTMQWTSREIRKKFDRLIWREVGRARILRSTRKTNLFPSNLLPAKKTGDRS